MTEAKSAPAPAPQGSPQNNNPRPAGKKAPPVAAATDAAHNGFLEMLGLLPGAPLDMVETKFLELIRDRIQNVTVPYDEDIVKGEERTLRLLHDQFFRTCMLWTAAEIKKPRPKRDHPEALAQKKNGRALIEGLQSQLIEFVLCYMHINRFTTFMHDEIRRTQARSVDGGKLKWTPDAGVMMARSLKQRREIRADIARAAGAREVLSQVDQELATVARSLGAIFGMDKQDPHSRRIVAALRKADFDRARNIVGEIKKSAEGKPQAEQNIPVFEQAAQRAIALIEEHKDALDSKDEGKLFLRPGETDIAYNSNIRELKRIHGFMQKYHLPYMEYKLGALQHLKDKLMVVGSLDSLMVVYRRLLAGLAEPMPDLRAVRMYESEVVGKVQYLMDTQFQEIPKIMERVLETVAEFRQNSSEVESGMADEKLTEVPIEQSEAATLPAK